MTMAKEATCIDVMGTVVRKTMIVGCILDYTLEMVRWLKSRGRAEEPAAGVYHSQCSGLERYLKWVQAV